MTADYDSPWKEALERYFPAFMAFFFPEAHADIAWEKSYRFLDKELQKVLRDAELGRREIGFARRMFSYNYRLFDRYARPVVSLAVLGEGQGETSDCFAYGRWGSATRFTFPVVCLNDYRNRQAALAASSNPFSVVVQAVLQAQATTNDPAARFRSKLELVKSLYRRGWVRQDILELFRVIDWLLQLPESLEDQLWRSGRGGTVAYASCNCRSRWKISSGWKCKNMRRRHKCAT